MECIKVHQVPCMAGYARIAIMQFLATINTLLRKSQPKSEKKLLLYLFQSLSSIIISYYIHASQQLECKYR